MAETITKILVRQGTDAQRRTANLTGITFSSGEPGFCIDTKRLYIGDGTTVGGNAIGIQNLGVVSSMFGNYGGSELSFDTYNRVDSKGAAAGDIIYDVETRSIYALTSVSNFPPLSSDFVQWDFSTLVNPSQFVYSNKLLNIQTGGIGNNELSLSIVDGVILTKAAQNAPISLKQESLTNAYLVKTPQNSLKGNFTSNVNTLQDFQVGPRTVVGRTSTSNLTAMSFDFILKEAEFNSENGIIIDQTSFPPTFKLDEEIIEATSTGVNIKKTTSITGALNITGLVNADSTIFCKGDVVAYYSPSDKKIKKNLTLLSDPVQKISQLNGYEFVFNENAPDHLINKSSYGLIAQEVESVLPYAIDERPTGIRGVNYEMVIPLLVESIKELKKEINDLKKSKCEGRCSH